MSNIALKIINEQLDELGHEQTGESGFVIDDDEKAEWALAKIREERAEAQRIINVCETMIQKYEEKIQAVKNRLPQRTAFLESKLMEYFEKVPHKKTKTMEKYELPSGVLKKKYPAPEFKRDEDKLLQWLKERNMTEYVKVKESPDWAEFKKSIKIVGDKVVDENGEIVDGITIVERPAEFIVEV
jgi:Bacteriophage Mu Gam like protein.